MKVDINKFYKLQGLIVDGLIEKLESDKKNNVPLDTTLVGQAINLLAKNNIVVEPSTTSDTADAKAQLMAMREKNDAARKEKLEAAKESLKVVSLKVVNGD